MDEQRPDPLRHGGQLLDLQRCPGCRRQLDPATMQEWGTPLGFDTREEAESLLNFYVCLTCFERAETDPDLAKRIDATGREWAAMNATLAAYRSDHADVL